MDLNSRNVWSHILDIDDSYLDEDTKFFEAGGDSVAALRLVVAKKVMTSPITNAKVSASALNMADHSSAMQSLRKKKKKMFTFLGQLTMLGLMDGQDA